MQRRPQTFRVFCIEHLHLFDVPQLAQEVHCPICGCQYIRLEQNEEVIAAAKNELAQVYLTESPPTWLDKLHTEVQGGD